MIKNEMKRVLEIVIGVGITFGLLTFYSWYTCSLDLDFAKSKVVEQLKEIGRSPAFLAYDAERTSRCRVAFVYKSGEDVIHFMVLPDGDVDWWDVGARGSLK